jgi:hypothetical protein
MTIVRREELGLTLRAKIQTTLSKLNKKGEKLETKHTVQDPVATLRSRKYADHSSQTMTLWQPEAKFWEDKSSDLRLEAA